MKKRKQYPKEFKARVALETIKGEKTIEQISSEYEVHSNMVTKWKKQLQENIGDIYMRKNDREPNDQELIDKLYRQIGKSQVEIDWLKKKLGF
jgi:transposase-like protein